MSYILRPGCVRDAATRARGGQRDRRGLSTEAPVGTHGQFAVLISPSCCPTGAHRRGPRRPAGAAGNRSRPPASRCQMRAGVCTCVGPNEAAHQSLSSHLHACRSLPAGWPAGAAALNLTNIARALDAFAPRRVSPSRARTASRCIE